MIASKRRAPTIDDLLRRQEEPQKRHRPSTSFQDHDDEGSRVDESREGSDEESSEDSESNGTELESGGEESTDSELSQETSPLDPGRVSLSSESPDLLGSRVSIKPKLASQRSQGESSGAGSSKNVTFSSLNISPPLLSTLSKMAIHAPTEIQQACIPPLLIGPNIRAVLPDYY
jgi:ATP-dependent RNA helicase DDX49/DBP8